MRIEFLLTFFYYIFLSLVKSEESVCDDVEKQWKYISNAIKNHPNIRCKNLPDDVPGGFYAHGETKLVVNHDEKVKIMKGNCIEALTSLLELHLPRNQRKFLFKFSDTNKVGDILSQFCEQSSISFFHISKFIDSKEHSQTAKVDNVLDSTYQEFEYPSQGKKYEKLSGHSFSSETKKMIDDSTSFLHSPPELSFEECEQGFSDYCDKFKDGSIPSLRSKSPKVLMVVLRSLLEDNREDLPVLEVAVAQLPKSIKNRVLTFFRSKNIDGIVELVNKLPKHIVESFINSIEIEKKQLSIKQTHKEQINYSIPLLEDEWTAIIEFMSDPSSPVQLGKKVNKKGIIKIPREFKYSNGLEKKFIQYCRRAIRSLAYDKFVSEDGVTYYAFNENNSNGIRIVGNDPDQRKEQVETFCFLVYEKLYGQKEKNLIKKRHMKILEMKKSWEEGGAEGAIIDELIKGFSNEINDERLQWLFLVESAGVPNPMVYSTDLPKTTIPISFTNKPTESAIEITGKIRSFIYNCRTALMTLGVEKYPGTKLPLYKLQLGPENIHGIIKFCKSVAHRYMGRLVEWFNIIQASLEDDVINLVSLKHPEFHCPTYFEYEGDNKLVDNCSKTILTMINENKKAEESGKSKVWMGLKINCQPNHINQHVRSFCKAVAYEKPEIRIATIKELSDLSVSDETSLFEKEIEGYSDEQQAIERVEERLKIIESKQIEDKSNSSYRLEKWNRLQDVMIENRKIREKLDKYSRNQFQSLFEIEDAQREIITSILNEIAINEKKRDEIRNIIDKYSSDVLSLRTEWADLLFQISNNNRKITESEIEIMNFVHQALDYTAISHRVELINSSIMSNMVDWEENLERKEKVYINSKIQEYNSRLESEKKLQQLKDLHFKRRSLFEKNLFRILPRKLWNRINSLGGRGLYPIMQTRASEKEIHDRKTLIVKLQEEKNNLIAKFDSEGQRLTRELLVIEKVVDKHLSELNEMWDNTYSIEYSIQWELRIKDMQDTYIYLNNEYNRHTEFITRQQLRQSQLQVGNPQYQKLLSETNQSIEVATEEMKKILRLMNELRQKRNELDTLVESDMSKNYAKKINTLRRISKLLEDNISMDINIVQKKNEISQTMLNRDIKYYEITNTKSALIERNKKNEGLIEANAWLNTKNDQLYLEYESKLKEDLNYLTYSFEKSTKPDQADLEEEIPKDGLIEIDKFKEQLKVNLFNIEIYNEYISDNDMQYIKQFELFDINTLNFRETFESEGELDDGTFYGELSTLEWNIIQSRWELLKMKHYFIEQKEKLLLECAEMRNNLDNLMIQSYGMVPVSRAKHIPNKANILLMEGIGINLGEKVMDEEKHLSYDEKVLKLVQKRLEDANSIFEQELSTRLSILDNKIREGRIRLHEAAREVVSNWELQQSTASFRFASPQNKDRMREAFVKERDKVTKDEIRKTRPTILEKHMLLQQQKDRALQFKRDIDWIHTPGRVASQLMKFEQKIRIFRKKRHDHYERTLNFLIYQAEQVDKIKEIDTELNSDDAAGVTPLPVEKIRELKREREHLEADLALKRKDYQMKLSDFQNIRDALYDTTRDLSEDEDS
ncbi:putative Secreted Protein [Cryptosporidium felis]|nr:putative Secreted Protein [Cryptosporidium felis]